MPVIVVGADTEIGERVVAALVGRAEVRAFVTAAESAERLRSLGVKVAVGDVSDASHLGGAALNCFTAVLVGDALADDRERSFAATSDGVIAAWAEALRDGGVRRAIWLGDDVPAVIAAAVAETAAVPADPEAPATVARLDERRAL